MAVTAQQAPPVDIVWTEGLRYALLAVPLAFVTLPVYVSLPFHYASSLGMPLSSLGAVMLGVRAMDAFIDPLLGRLSDGLFGHGEPAAWRVTALACILLGLSFAALWTPPSVARPALAAWLSMALLLTTLAYSGVSIVYQSWGARWGGSATWRAGVAAWREAGSLTGVLLASVLPFWLGWRASCAALVGLLGLGLAGLRGLRGSTPTPTPTPAPAPTARPARSPVHADEQAETAAPLAHAPFRDLLFVFMLSGIGSAVAATLLPFFVEDRLRLPGWQGPLLLVYFGAAVAGLPAWVRAAGRWGLAPVWRVGMLSVVLAFCVVPWLGAGDGAGFAAVCLATGLTLGADLALPGALLTGEIHRAGAGHRGAGAFLGWWTCASKLNLALAAGLALPLLELVGYQAGGRDPAGLRALSWCYGGLPCLFKLASAVALWRAEQRHPNWKERG